MRILLIGLLLLVKPTNATTTMYDIQMHRQALIAANKYFGSDYKVESVRTIEGGLGELTLIGTGDGEKVTAYLLQDLKTIIIGQLFSPYMVENGHNQHTQRISKQNADVLEARKKIYQASSAPSPLSQIQGSLNSNQKQAFPKQVDNPADKVFANIQRLKTISVGDGRKTAYVFFDFGCNGCKDLYKDLVPHLAKMNLSLELIPVTHTGRNIDGKLNDTDFKGIYSLQDEKITSEFIELLLDTKRFDDVVAQATKSDHLSDYVQLSKSQLKTNFQRLRENTLVFFQLPNPMTPTFVYNTDSGPKISTPFTIENVQKIASLIPEESINGTLMTQNAVLE